MSDDTTPRAASRHLPAILLAVCLVGGLLLLTAWWLSSSSQVLTGSFNRRSDEQAWLEGQRAMQAGDYTAAVEAFARAVANSPNPSTQMRFDLGLAAEKAGDFVRAASEQAIAVDMAERTYRQNPKGGLFVDPFFGLADAYRLLGQPEAEYAVWKRLLALDPKQYPAHYRMAVILASQGRNAEAQEQMRRCLSLIPEKDKGTYIDAKYVAFMGDLQLVAGETREALKTYQRALAISPNDKTLRYKLDSCRKKLALESNDR